MKAVSTFDEVFGWYGMSAIILSYALVSYGLVSAVGLLYQALNITGAAGVIWISYKKKVWQSVTLNVFWAVIGIIAVIRILIIHL